MKKRDVAKAVALRYDQAKNKAAKGFEETSVISSDKSITSVLIIPTNEERIIADEAFHAVKKL